jgi:hypothetical protein
LGLTCRLNHKENWEAAAKTTLPANYQVHHIIPFELEAQVKAICPNYDMDSKNNLIALPTTQAQADKTSANQWFGKTIHRGHHPGYSKAVAMALKKLKASKNKCPSLKKLQDILRAKLMMGGSALNRSGDTQANTESVNADFSDYLDAS